MVPVLSSHGHGQMHMPATGRRRVLIVSARIGGGHDATGRALEEAVRDRWPDSAVRWVDTLDAMGPGVRTTFCSIYTASVERMPWLYDLFYGATWRYAWFAQASKRFTGSWAGRRLAREIDAFAPEIILSTYPLGSGGLAWLRRHRGLPTPTAAWVSDFAPHPFWVYADVDTTFVVHETAVSTARLADPRAHVEVSALPVQKVFQPGDVSAARQHFDLREDAFVVLVSCGTFAFGVSESMVRGLVETDDRIQLVVACGRNAEALARLERLDFDRKQVVPLGWTKDMPLLNQAADVVVTNAGGATALEAVASGRPVLMLDPIAAHGAANASLMAVAGLAEVCTSEAQLAARLRGVLRDADTGTDAVPLRDLGRAASDQKARQDLVGDLGRLLEAPAGAPTGTAPSRTSPSAPLRPWPMRPADAFFAHVEEGGIAQEIGVVLDLDPLPGGGSVGAEHVRAVVAARIGHLTPLRLQPVRRGRRLGWVHWDHVEVADHVDERQVCSAAEASAVLDDFWTTVLPRDRPTWRMLVIRQDDRRALLAMKVHHCLGDGLSALGLLDWLLDSDLDGGSPQAAAARNVARVPTRRVATKPVSAVRKAARGLWHLASRGTAPRHPLNGHGFGARSTTIEPAPTVVLETLPARMLREAAGRMGARSFELAIGVVAEGLSRLLRPAGLVDGDRCLRAFVPLSARQMSDERILGNWTTAVPVELAMGEMAPTERLARLRADLERGVSLGVPLAAGLVMRVTGHLPASAHAWFARNTYSDRFLNLIVSYVPGPRGGRRIAGARVRSLHPIAPLTRRIPISIGMISMDDTVGLGILLDRGLGLAPDAVGAAVQGAFADLVEV
jgi:diacylglycerol O-acyltransferase / wax synthase